MSHFTDAEIERVWLAYATPRLYGSIKDSYDAFVAALSALRPSAPVSGEPIPMFLTCPKCNERHIDEGEFATKPHHTHSCQKCGLTWRPAVGPTVGVAFLPGFKNDAAPSPDSARIERLLSLGDVMADELAVWTNDGLQMCHCCNHKAPINETIQHDSMCPVAAWIAGRDE